MEKVSEIIISTIIIIIIHIRNNTNHHINVLLHIAERYKVVQTTNI